MTACRPRRPPVAVVLSAVVVWLVAALLAPAGAAAQTRDGEWSLDLQVARIRGVLGPDDALSTRVRVANRSRQERSDLRVLVTLHRRTTARWEYQSALDEGQVGNIIDGFGVDLGTIPARGARTIDFERTATELGLARFGTQEGVYPLRFQLLADGDVVDEVVTSLVLTSAELAEPLPVALLLPIAAPPTRRGDGTYGPEGVVSSAARPGGALYDAVAAVAARPEAPVTLAVDPLVVEEAAGLSDGFELVGDGERATFDADSLPARQAAAFGALLGETVRSEHTAAIVLPYGSADLTGLVRAGLEGEAQRQVTDSARELERWTRTRPVEGILWPPAAVDEATIARLRAVRADTLVLSEDHLQVERDRDDRSPGAVRRVRAGAGTTVDALVPDPWLERTLGNPPGEVDLATQRVVGEIAAVYFERPGQQGRSLLLAPPVDRPLPRGLAAGLLTGLHNAPFAELVTVPDLLEEVEAQDGARLAYPPEARMRELPPSYLAGLTTARQRLGSLEGVLVNDPETPARFDRLLLQAASVHYRGARQRHGEELIATVAGAVANLYGSVQVLEGPPVTLTAVEGSVPVTLRSSADEPLRVLLQLGGPRFEVEDGATREIILEPGSTEVITVRVRALTPGGTGPLQVQVTDLDGLLVLATGTVVVRSTAFSVVAIVVTAGAALFLLAWWGRGRARRRRETTGVEQREPAAVG